MADPNSKWERFDVANKVRAILGQLRQGYPYESYPGQPYLSAYQLAIEFKRQYPEEFREIGLEVGGAGSGNYYGLANYFAKWIPSKMPDIEMAFLHQQNLPSVRFTDDIMASTPYLMMFRVRE